MSFQCLNVPHILLGLVKHSTTQYLPCPKYMYLFSHAHSNTMSQYTSIHITMSESLFYASIHITMSANHVDLFIPFNQTIIQSHIQLTSIPRYIVSFIILCQVVYSIMSSVSSIIVYYPKEVPMFIQSQYVRSA